jgi:hypothetical protein
MEAEEANPVTHYGARNYRVGSFSGNEPKLKTEELFPQNRNSLLFCKAF